MQFKKSLYNIIQYLRKICGIVTHNTFIITHINNYNMKIM